MINIALKSFNNKNLEDFFFSPIYIYICSDNMHIFQIIDTFFLFAYHFYKE